MDAKNQLKELREKIRNKTQECVKAVEDLKQQRIAAYVVLEKKEEKEKK